LRCMQVIATSPLKDKVTDAMKNETYFFYQKPESSPEFWHATRYIKDYFGGSDGDKDLLDAVERFIKHDFGWWIELLPHLFTGDFSVIWNVVDPQDGRALPVLFRALRIMEWVGDTEMIVRVSAPMRQAMRRYISAVPDCQDHPDGETRIEAKTMILSIKQHIHQLRKQYNSSKGRAGQRQAILVFAKAVSAAVDEYQFSIGNQEEVERSRKRTMFLRRQIKPFFVERGFITEDSPFEEEGTTDEPAVGTVEWMDSDSDDIVPLPSFSASVDHGTELPETDSLSSRPS